jgi:hypothetical protein
MADFRCPVCDTSAEHEQGTNFADVRCGRCGRFLVSMLDGMPRLSSPEHRVKLSGWVREQNAAGIVPIITASIAQRVEAMPLPRYLERAHKALTVIMRKYPSPHGWAAEHEVRQDLEVMGTSYSADEAAVGVLLLILEREGYVDRGGGRGHCRVTIAGMLAVEQMSAPSSASIQGFVKMDFAESMREAWTNGFDPGIRAAGFRPMRIDAKDYVGGITDEIMSEIRQSRFVIADYTGQKAGVYFEAGFALGLGLTVIPTCRTDEIGRLHFDIRHLNTLPWTTPDDLADSLTKRIRAVIGTGPNLAHKTA